MKFRAHDTFFIRKGWLSKGMKYVNIKGDIFISKTENPMDVLGIGANMVKALRYWLQAVGLTKDCPVIWMNCLSCVSLWESHIVSSLS